MDIYRATGRRKEATASVRLKSGKGNFMINDRLADKYLLRDTLVRRVQEPMAVTETLGQYDVTCKTTGGGLSGQAGAISLAIARALVKINPDLQTKLRREGYLTRDPRAVERKKYGQPKARKKFQYSKR